MVGSYLETTHRKYTSVSVNRLTSNGDICCSISNTTGSTSGYRRNQKRNSAAQVVLLLENAMKHSGTFDVMSILNSGGTEICIINANNSYRFNGYATNYIRH